jgi:hypothetical protein
MSPSHTSGGEFTSDESRPVLRTAAKYQERKKRDDGEIRRSEVKQRGQQQRYCRERHVGSQHGSENAALIAAVQQHPSEKLRQTAKDRIGAVPLVKITAGAMSQPSQRRQEETAETGLGGGTGAPQHRK